ncbi:signal peptidase I [Glaciihabitans sp. dw_435]|uniref:signal peptidase I n=1 Tax=Glaciihabitans sp. dw_435 TaxID=2720081 RepID=UPI001BD605F3|nr:signal peptidase I [Glaciihabitans sp. dw_435]
MAMAGPMRHTRTLRYSRPGRVLPVVGRIGNVIAWIVASVTILLIVALVLVPRITGATPYTVLTGSMTPVMPPGTMVVVRPVDFGSIRVGDVVTYQIESGQPAVVTHRVVAINISSQNTTLTTRGDANPVADAKPVMEAQVRGTVWYWVPMVGYLTSMASGGDRQVLAQIAGGALIAYALFVLIAAIRTSRREKRGAGRRRESG